MAIVLDKIGLLVTQSSENEIEGLVTNNDFDKWYFEASINGTLIAVPGFAGDWKVTRFQSMKNFSVVKIERVRL
jgi:hypothetical protein